MTNQATESLLNALSLNPETTHADEEVAKVATTWFAHWLQNRANTELIDGDTESANGLMRASYELTNLE